MDQLTFYLAKLLGLYFLIIGISIIFKTSHYQKSMKELSTSEALMMLISIMPLVVGLSIILGHNLWVKSWPVIITIIGWLIFLVGLIRLFWYKKVMKIISKKADHKSFLVTMGVIVTLIGAGLTYLGFRG
jgi:hypothetical protein